ncbi:GntR family transcriptional regulator [Paenibacillus sp. CC-CFT747]|nr:GntR family transcriptional regulator [Paenibacillus sp. CC-CFT747]
MRIPIQLSPESPEPMYHQIKEQLRALILSGELKEGLLLPSIREFALDLACSVITIRRVYQDLEQEGFLRTRQGTGTFVARVDSGDRERFRSQALEAAFREAVELGRRLQCPAEDMERLFKEILEERESKKTQLPGNSE